MRDRFLAAWRTGAQYLIPTVLALLTAHGIRVSDNVAGVALVVAMAVGVALWAAGTHWLQSRQGNSAWARLARGVGRLLVLGPAALPQYTDPAK